MVDSALRIILVGSRCTQVGELVSRLDIWDRPKCEDRLDSRGYLLGLPRLQRRVTRIGHGLDSTNHGCVTPCRNRRGYADVGGIARYFSKPFVRTKEKCLVLSDRAAEGSAKLVSLKRSGATTSPRYRCGQRVQNVEVVSSIQSTVPQIFEHVAVKLIRSALCDDRRLATHHKAIFRAERIRHNSIFTDAIQSQREAGDR